MKQRLEKRQEVSLYFDQALFRRRGVRLYSVHPLVWQGSNKLGFTCKGIAGFADQYRDQ